MILNNISDLKAKFVQAIEEHESIGIVTHINPDGDGFAACLALKKLLKDFNKKTDIILEKEITEQYDFIDGNKESITMNDSLSYTLLILLDCHESKRIGICSPLVDKAEAVFAIDHHPLREEIANSYTYIDTDSASVGVIVWNLFREKIAESENAVYIAKAIYTTILNDTDNFLNANTDSAVFNICSDLCKFDIKPGEITRHFIMGKKPMELKFIGKVMNTIEMHNKNRIMFLVSTRHDLDELDLDSHATSKITRWVKGARDVIAVVYFREIAEDTYRLSLRTETLNVNKIAVSYGGGGHVRASGCEIKGKLEDVKKDILKSLNEQID